MIEIQKIEQYNHWWIKNSVDFELALPFKRKIYLEIQTNLKERFILALTGLRRIGKTTTMYQLIQELLNEKIDKTSIFFFSFDENNVGLTEAIESYKEFQKKDFRDKKVYIFLDEIQKCKNWENEIKKYYDLYPKLKFIISGSESLFIKKKTKETLAGRILEYELGTFSFREFLELKNLNPDEFKYETKIKPLFLEFVERGGFPETFNMSNEKDFKEYIMSLVVDKIVYKDIPRMFKLEDPEFLRVLLEVIATNPGMYVDYQSLGKQFSKDRRVVKQYLNYLNESFLIKILGNHRKTNISTLRKKKRAYPSDNAIIKLYKPVINIDFLGKMVETLAINKLNANSFWKNGNEIDIVHENIPIEIKYQEQINSHDLKPLKEFMKKFNQKKAILISKNLEQTITVQEGVIQVIPAWKWFLE
jgi:uncharacterized protein